MLCGVELDHFDGGRSSTYVYSLQIDRTTMLKKFLQLELPSSDPSRDVGFPGPDGYRGSVTVNIEVSINSMLLRLRPGNRSAGS